MMLDASSRRSFEPTKFCLDLMAQNFRLKCPKGVLKATKKGFNSAKSLFIPVRKNEAQRGGDWPRATQLGCSEDRRLVFFPTYFLPLGAAQSSEGDGCTRITHGSGKRSSPPCVGWRKLHYSSDCAYVLGYLCLLVGARLPLVSGSAPLHPLFALRTQSTFN